MTDKQRLALVRSAKTHLKKTQKGWLEKPEGGGSEWKKAMTALDTLEKDLAVAVPALGPVVTGGVSILGQDLTHSTGGLDHYPAFDDGFAHPGRAVLAPEALTVTRQSSARRRDGGPNGKAFYATGNSKLRYWFGHVDVAPPVGKRFVKGQTMARISENHEMPHVHVGIDARELLGRDLLHHTNYTHGAPKVGVQLAQPFT